MSIAPVTPNKVNAATSGHHLKQWGLASSACPHSRKLSTRVTPGHSVQVQAADAVLIADATDRLGQQPRNRQLPDAPTLFRRRRQRDGVGHHQLVERRL